MEPGEYHSLRAVEDHHWWFRSLYDHVLATIRARSPDRPLLLLDAGGGTGGLALRLAKLGAVEVLDASEEAIRLCRERGLRQATVADLNEVELPAGRYDVITSVDVLYHRGILDERRVLRELTASLAPGGLLFLHLPAFEALRSEHDRRVHTARRYRLPEVERGLRECGLTVEHSSYRVTFALPAILLARVAFAGWRRIAGSTARERSEVRLPPAPFNALLLALARLENAVSRRVRLPFGLSLFAVARKAERRRDEGA